MTGLMMQFTYEYTDSHREKLKQYTEMRPLSKYLEKQNLVNAFAQYAEKNGLKRRNLMIKKSYQLLQTAICGRIIYNILDDNAFMEYINQDDNCIKEAVKVFKEGRSFPQKEEAASLADKPKK